MSDPLMSLEEVAEYLGINPSSVHTTMRRANIPLEKGYRRSRVVQMQRRGQGHRTDLEK